MNDTTKSVWPKIYPKYNNNCYHDIVLFEPTSSPFPCKGEPLKFVYSKTIILSKGTLQYFDIWQQSTEHEYQLFPNPS